MTAQPKILQGVKGHCEVRFTYAFKGGEAGYVSGHFSRTLGAEAVTGIEVRVDPVRSKIPAGVEVPEDGLIKFALARITPDSATGLIIPLSRKEREELGI